MQKPINNGNLNGHSGVAGELPAPMTNGASGGHSGGQSEGQGGSPPGLGQVMIQPTTTNQNIFRELITTSTKAEEYLPQSFLTQEELDVDIRVLMMMNAWLDDDPNVPHAMWYSYAGSLAVNARGRTHLAVLMGGGQGLRLLDRAKGAFSGLWDRGARNIDKPHMNSTQNNMGGQQQAG